jgi:hypothetical protein
MNSVDQKNHRNFTDAPAVRAELLPEAARMLRPSQVDHFELVYECGQSPQALAT